MKIIIKDIKNIDDNFYIQEVLLSAFPQLVGFANTKKAIEVKKFEIIRIDNCEEFGGGQPLGLNVGFESNFPKCPNHKVISMNNIKVYELENIIREEENK